MIRSDLFRPESLSPGEVVTINQTTFSQLYDQYAPALLGVISAIVGDETEAVRLLEITFVRVRTEFGRTKPENQPLFVWLLSIARSTALEATEGQTKPGMTVLRFTDMGWVTTGSSTRNGPATAATDTHSPTPSPMSELLDAVLIKNCAPEEAASLVGLPVTTARQHLRSAMQQFRASGTV